MKITSNMMYNGYFKCITLIILQLRIIKIFLNLQYKTTTDPGEPSL